jgi:hypothetical protein
MDSLNTDLFSRLTFIIPVLEAQFLDGEHVLATVINSFGGEDIGASILESLDDLKI